jgi:hypothetical protein
MLQSPAGTHTSIHLKQLVDCLLAQPSEAPVTVACPCEKPVVDHRQVAPTTTQLLYKNLFTYPEPTCGYVVDNPTSVCRSGYTQIRRYAPQAKIEYICRTNQRPVASTIIAQKREAAAAFKVYKPHERPIAQPPCPPMPQMAQPGVPRARCFGSRN